jgi:hypothetical protein
VEYKGQWSEAITIISCFLAKRKKERKKERKEGRKE